jgi:epoxyqueuosine reductase
MGNVPVRLEMKQLKTNPSLYLQKVFKQYLANSPENFLHEFQGIPIFDDVLVGIADGDDPIFQDYKTLIGNFHLTPREALEKYLHECTGIVDKHPHRISVISLVLTTPHTIRLNMRRETVLASKLGNNSACEQKAFSLHQIPDYLISMLKDLGHQAVAPSCTDCFRVIELPQGPASTWSEKHIAYAAGLGTFGLSASLITPRGITIHCVSVVTDLALPSNPRLYPDHLANCSFFQDGSCGRCIDRCPVGAITKQGFNKIRCRDYQEREQPEMIKQMGKTGYISEPTCGLCQMKVPCEDRIPPSKKVTKHK